ncbi:MAG: RDD family protein [Actinomycetota bacterium]
METREGFVTPEAVMLEADLAGLGSRFMAALLDAVIQFGAILITGAVYAATQSEAALIVYLVTAFLMVFGYPIVLETATRGKTVGKLAAGIRVVRTDGQPVTFPVVLVRNLLRLVDILPAAYAMGVVAILVTKRGQRLGDLAAGTVMVYDVPALPPQQLHLGESPDRDRATRGMDPAGLTPQEYALVRSFLLRRHSLDPAARTRLAADLKARLNDRVGSDAADASAETFLEAVATAYRNRQAP